MTNRNIIKIQLNTAKAENKDLEKDLKADQKLIDKLRRKNDSIERAKDKAAIQAATATSLDGTKQARILQLEKNVNDLTTLYNTEVQKVKDNIGLLGQETSKAIVYESQLNAARGDLLAARTEVTGLKVDKAGLDKDKHYLGKDVTRLEGDKTKLEILVDGDPAVTGDKGLRGKLTAEELRVAAKDKDLAVAEKNKDLEVALHQGIINVKDAEQAAANANQARITTERDDYKTKHEAAETAEKDRLLADNKKYRRISYVGAAVTAFLALAGAYVAGRSGYTQPQEKPKIEKVEDKPKAAEKSTKTEAPKTAEKPADKSAKPEAPKTAEKTVPAQPYFSVEARAEGTASWTTVDPETKATEYQVAYKNQRMDGTEEKVTRAIHPDAVHGEEGINSLIKTLKRYENRADLEPAQYKKLIERLPYLNTADLGNLETITKLDVVKAHELAKKGGLKAIFGE